MLLDIARPQPQLPPAVPVVPLQEADFRTIPEPGTAPEPCAMMSAALDSLGLALFVVDPLGRIVAASQAARSSPTSWSAVASAAPGLVRRAAREGRAAGQAVDGENGNQVWLVATPMAGSPSLETQHFTVQAIDSNGPQQVAPALLGEICGLTPAEAKVVRFVADGLSPKAMAIRLGISLATVKTHLHRGFRKTGARGQADLVRRIARIAPQRATT
jgi:DNA-binding CsgD family transcriptional regulator